MVKHIMPYKSTYSKSKSTYSKSKSKPAYCYSLNLKNGKKYVGYTSNPKQRLKAHFQGNGAKATQRHKPVSVNHIQKCQNVAKAKKAETIVYQKMSQYHGKSNVRQW